MNISKEKQVEMYRGLYTVRRVEEKLNDLFARNLYPGYIAFIFGGGGVCGGGMCGVAAG